MRGKTFAVAALALSLLVTVAACEDSTDGNGTPTQAPPTTSSPTPTPPTTEQGQVPLDTAQGAVFSGNTAGNTDFTATEQYLDDVVQHIDTVWTNWFATEGLQEPWVGYQVVGPGEQYTSNCVINNVNVFGSNYPNAFYCPTDMNTSDAGVLVLPVETMAKMWTGNVFEQQVSDLKLVGDYAAGMITAHEYGHHVQDEFTENYEVTEPANPNIELIADCFAGVWTHSVDLDQQLESGDVDEALNALEVIGDNTGSHGTGEERKNAYLIGLYGSEADPRGGVPDTCITAFWPELAAARSTG